MLLEQSCWWFWLFLVGLISACAKTRPATTPVTTTTPMMTPVCQTCSLSTIQLTPMMGAGTIDVQNGGVSVGANGCNQLTVTCNAGAGNTAFMQFNTNQGGPDMAMGQVVTAMLTCDGNGNWIYTGMNGQSRVITEVNCVATM